MNKSIQIVSGLFMVIAWCLSTTSFVNAQAPQKIDYQGIARNNTNEPLSNQHLGIQISIIQGELPGVVVYQERHEVNTDAFGLFTFPIGTGEVQHGVFAAINWGEDASFVQIEIDPEGGSSYEDLGTMELMSVPFALYAESAGTSEKPAHEWSNTSLRFEKSDGSWGSYVDLQGQQGPAGKDGTGVNIIGSVPSVSNLDANYNGNVGDMFLAEDTGAGHVWNGSAWVEVGQIQGPPGPAGTTTWNGITNIPAGFSDNIDDVEDNDADPANEIQKLDIIGDILSLSENGGQVDLSDYLDNQTLEVNDNELSISEGNSVVLPSSPWVIESNNDIFYENGSVRIGAYASSPDYPLTVTNGIFSNTISGSGVDGVFVANADVNGMTILEANQTGIYIVETGGPGAYVFNSGSVGFGVYQAEGDGFSVSSAGDDGVYVQSSDGDGIEIENASESGIEVGTSGSNGMYIQSAGLNGIEIDNSFFYGINLGTTGNDGINVNSAGNDGMHIQNAGVHGIKIGTVANDGVNIFQAGSNGIYINETEVDGIRINATGNDGMNILSAGGDGVDILSAAQSGIKIGSTENSGVYINSAGSDGVYINSAGLDGIYIDNAAEDGLQIVNTGGSGVKIGTTAFNGVDIINSGYDGIHIYEAGNEGIQIDIADSNGINIDEAGNDGVHIGTSGTDGISINSAGRDGVYIDDAAVNGLHIVNANTGITLASTEYNGIQIINSGTDGILIYDAGNDGIRINSASDDGLEIENASNDGVYINSAGNDGLHMESIGHDGIYIGDAGDTGVQVRADNVGMYANSTQADNEWGFYTPDKMHATYGYSGFNTIITSIVVNAGSQILEEGDLVCLSAHNGNRSDFEGKEALYVEKLNERNAHAVVGVVDHKMLIEEKIKVKENGEEERTATFSQSAEGAQSGDYVSIVVYGMTDVKINRASAIRTGDKLIASTDNAIARKPQSNDNPWTSSVIGKAMEDSKGKDKIKVLVNCK